MEGGVVENIDVAGLYISFSAFKLWFSTNHNRKANEPQNKCVVASGEL